MPTKRIGILTGGGDVPGLNSVIKNVVYRGTEADCEVIGIRRGWEGLTHVNFDDPASKARYILPLNKEITRNVDRTGGTFLHSSRTNPSKMKKLPPFLTNENFPKNGTTWDMSARVLKNIETLNLDYLIAIGGDDTLSYAARLDKLGMKVIAIPSIASASPPPSPAPPAPLSASAPPSAAMNASEFFASSAATPATPRSIPPSPVPSAAASRNTR
jgi:6-phosphofructokinase